MKARTILIILSIALVVLIILYLISPKNYKNEYHPILEQIRENFSRLNPEYANIPLRTGDSAYTEDKAVITMCLKDPDTGKYYDINTLMYVALHELAHVVTTSQGHGDEFKRNFAILLNQAAKEGIYDPNIPIPPTYCGVGPES